jgi:subtilisin family serine protease
MNWSRLWPSRWARGQTAPVRRTPSTARLAIEQLEDRCVPTTTSAAALQAWKKETFSINDQTVATPVQLSDLGLTDQAVAPVNASFGSMIGLPSAFANTPYRGQGYSVAVIDTGIDYLDPSLGGGFGPGYRVIAGWNFVNNTANPMDDNGHGTVVAGEIGSSDATYSGVAPDVNLIALKVLDANGSGTFGNVQAALDWVVANQAKYSIVAINMSLGSGNYTTNPYTFLDGEFTTLKNDGVFIAVAAGNSYFTNSSALGLDFPAVDPLVVSVGAVYNGTYGKMAWENGAIDYTTAPDLIASFSQRDSSLSILAPGALVTSTYLNNTFETMAGTSMATPVITGAAVLIHQALAADHLPANEASILKIMQTTGVTVVDGTQENNNVIHTGLSFKRIDVGAALASIGLPSASPTLQPINSAILAPGTSTTITLFGSEPGVTALTYLASVLASPAAQAYQLKQQLGLQYAGTYYLNQWGDHEKWIKGAGGAWYCILPNGQLRKCAGNLATTLLPANLIATLPTSYYTDPSTLWNAQPSTAVPPTLTIVGNKLTIAAPASATGSYQIQVTVSDGKLTASQTFSLTIQAASTPQITAIATQSMLTNRSLVVTLAAADANNSMMNYTATLVGTYASVPASLVVSGNQLTIYSSTDYVGSFNVQVTASNGVLSASTTFQVNVAASSVAFRLTGNFTGNGIADTAFLNADGSWWVSIPNANGGFVDQNWGAWAAGSNWKLVQVGDVNGEGKADVIGFTNAGAWWVGASTGSSFTSKLWAQWSAASNWDYVTTGDVNGDGKTDIVGFTTGGAWWVGASTGATFTTQFWTQWAPASSWSDIYATDLNDDGRLDIVGKYKTTGKYFVGYSSGTTFSTTLWTAATPPAGAS